MSYKTCPDCGERVYSLGCTWCNEEAYINQQARFDALSAAERAEIHSDRGEQAIAIQDRRRAWPQADNE